MHFARSQGLQRARVQLVASGHVQLSDRQWDQVHVRDVAFRQVQTRQARKTLQMEQSLVRDEATTETQFPPLDTQFAVPQFVQAVVSDARALGAESFQVREAAGQDVHLVGVDPSAVVYRQALHRRVNTQPTPRLEQKMAPVRHIQGVEFGPEWQQVAQLLRWILVRVVAVHAEHAQLAMCRELVQAGHSRRAAANGREALQAQVWQHLPIKVPRHCQDPKFGQVGKERKVREPRIDSTDNGPGFHRILSY